MGGAARRICWYGASYSCIINCSIWLLVITGATDGIGREFALQLAKAGFGVVLVSRNPEKLQKLANEIGESLSPRCQSIDSSVQSRSTVSMLRSKRLTFLGTIRLMHTKP